jgi:hypothetical protein
VSAALTPRLTRLDRRVLASLPGRDEPGVRIFDTFTAPRHWWCPYHGRMLARGAVRGCSTCVRALDAIADVYEEHCEVLRGLEAVGLATCHGGWWRQA